jgi:hypothetical protein
VANDKPLFNELNHGDFTVEDDTLIASAAAHGSASRPLSRPENPQV